jgi:hypothetical protein
MTYHQAQIMHEAALVAADEAFRAVTEARAAYRRSSSAARAEALRIACERHDKACKASRSLQTTLEREYAKEAAERRAADRREPFANQPGLFEPVQPDLF